MSSKSILIILSYTVSKFVRFFRDTVYIPHSSDLPDNSDVKYDATWSYCAISAEKAYFTRDRGSG